MTTNTKSNAKTSPDEAVKKAVADTPGGTTEGIAQVAGIARSTAGKVLGRLADKSDITRHKGGRDGGKRLPDRFTLAGVEMPPAYAAHVTSGALREPAASEQRGIGKPGGASNGKGGKADSKRASGGSAGKPATGASADGDRRLKAGGLEPLVLDYLKKNADSGPHGPTAVAKALERSSGAVGNCLVRLTDAKKVEQVSEKPRRYSLAA
jgi:hypothetical protein